MGGEPISVSTEDLYRVRDALQEPQRTFHDAHSRLLTGLTEVGDPFGNDATGNSFRMLYEPTASKTTNVANEVDTGFTNIQNNFNNTGLAYDSTEEINKQ